jgi:1-acyl-sn-glycerol-3-phosphate acyltransferase
MSTATKAPKNGSTVNAVKPPVAQPDAAPKTAKAPKAPPSGLAGVIAKRAAKWDIDGPDPRLMEGQRHFWNFMMDHYFRMEMDGWDRLPADPSLLIGIHSGGSLTMDAWTVLFQWWRRFGEERTLHGTAHDVLMASPGLGDYFRALGVLPPTVNAMKTAFEAGHDVVLWPGGEVDAMRTWRDRDKAVLGGRQGFVRFAIRQQVPIVPIATVGGHDTVFVLSEGRFLAKHTGLGKALRTSTLPIISGFPFPLAIEALPMHLPLPAKIRTELLEPFHLDPDPEKAKDAVYVDEIYREVEAAIQAGMKRLAKRRSFPIFG